MDEALRDAITFGNLDDCEVLLATGVPPHAVDDDAGSPLHLAASLNESQIISLLLDYGAPINIQNRDGDTPLHIASVTASWAARGNFEACEVLVKRNADTRLRNDAKKTILEVAERTNKSLAAKIKLWLQEYTDSKRQNVGVNPASSRSIPVPPVRSSSQQDFRSKPEQPKARQMEVSKEPLTSQAQRIIQKLKEENQAQEEEIGALQNQIRTLKTRISEKELQFQNLEAELRTAAGLLQQKSANLAKREQHLESQSKQLQQHSDSANLASISVAIVSMSDLFLIKHIATGGSGSEIFKAAWCNSIFAFKKVAPRYRTISNGAATKRSNEEWLTVHLTEIRLLCRLRHKNIVSLVAASPDPRQMSLVFEYHKSRDLRAVLSSRIDITPAQRTSWALGAARALAFLHAQSPRPLLHMNINSSNFLVDGMHLKLTDFSNCAITALAGDWEDHSLLPRGHAAYLAPEQFKQEPVSEKTDVFSFGVILWELWTRQEPWSGVASGSIEANILIGDRLQIPVGEIPATIARLIKKCWLEEPSDRPDMNEIVTEIWNFKRLGAGKSPATPYPISGHSSMVSSANVVLSPRRTALIETPLKTPISSVRDSAAVLVPQPASTPPPSGTTVVPVPLPILPAGSSPLSAFPKVSTTSPTPQRFAPSLQKYKLQLLAQMNTDPSSAPSSGQSSPTASPPSNKEQTPGNTSPTSNTVVITTPAATETPSTQETEPAASAAPSKPPTQQQPSEMSEVDAVDQVLDILDSLSIGASSFEPPKLLSSSSSRNDLSDPRRVSTIDDILQHAESLLSDVK